MNPITFNLPKNARQHGMIFPTHIPDYLTSDMAEFVLPNGIVVDVGWHPENDPRGAFVVSIFDRDWDNQLQDQIVIQGFDALQATVEELARRYSSSVFASTSSTSNPYSQTQDWHQSWYEQQPNCSVSELPLARVA